MGEEGERERFDSKARDPNAGLGVCAACVACRTCPLRRALAVVGVDPVHTQASVHTLVARAVVHVGLAVMAFESWERQKCKRGG